MKDMLIEWIEAAAACSGSIVGQHLEFSSSRSIAFSNPADLIAVNFVEMFMAISFYLFPLILMFKLSKCVVDF